MEGRKTYKTKPVTNIFFWINFKLYLILVYWYVWRKKQWHTNRDEKTIFRSWFFPSTTGMETKEESVGNTVHEGSALPIELTHQFHFKSLSVKLLHTIRNQVQNIWLLNNFKVNTFAFNELKRNLFCCISTNCIYSPS